MTLPAVTGFGSLSASATACSAPEPRSSKAIFEFGGGGLGRVMALLQLPCLAMVDAWVMRANAVRSQSAGGSQATGTRVTVDLRLAPTLLPSHRDAPDLPGSPPWVHKVERLQLQRASVVGPAPLPPSALASTTHHNLPALTPHHATLPPPSAVSRDVPATRAHTTPRTPSYILAAKQKCERRQSPPGSRGSERGATAAAPVQLVVLDDRFRMSPSPKQQTRPDSNLSASCVPGTSSPNDAEAASLFGLHEHNVTKKDMPRWNMGTPALCFAKLCCTQMLVESLSNMFSSAHNFSLRLQGLFMIPTHPSTSLIDAILSQHR